MLKHVGYINIIFMRWEYFKIHLLGVSLWVCNLKYCGVVRKFKVNNWLLDVLDEQQYRVCGSWLSEWGFDEADRIARKKYYVLAEVQYILHSDCLAWRFLPTRCSVWVRVIVTCYVTRRYCWIQGVKPAYCMFHVYTPCDSYIGAECHSKFLRATRVFCQKPSSRRKINSAVLFQRRIFLPLQLYWTLMDTLIFRTIFCWLRKAGKG